MEDKNKKIVKTIKVAIYTVLDNILENNNLSIFTFVIFHLIEFFQLLYFNFDFLVRIFDYKLFVVRIFLEW